MNEKWLDEKIKKEFLKEAEETEKEILEKMEYDEKFCKLKAPDVMFGYIKRKIGDIKDEDKKSVLAALSEEDRKAMEIGRKYLEEQKALEENGKKRRKFLFFSKKRYKVLATAAAVFAIILTVSFTGESSRQYLMRKVSTIFEGDTVSIDVTNVEDKNDLYTERENKKDIIDKELDLDSIKVKMGVRPIDINKNGLLKYEKINYYNQNKVAVITYKYEEHIVSVNITRGYKDTQHSILIKGSKESKFITTKEDNVEFEVFESKEEEGKAVYSANVIFEGTFYTITGLFEEETFAELIENIVFL